jgi:hypothetical protein
MGRMDNPGSSVHRGRGSLAGTPPPGLLDCRDSSSSTLLVREAMRNHAMRRSMITIAALTALLLLAGSIPEADAAAPTRIRVMQSLRDSPGNDTFNVNGSGGYPPSTGILVRIYRDSDLLGDQPTTTDSRGRWSFGIGWSCGLGYQTVTFSTTATDATTIVNTRC